MEGDYQPDIPLKLRFLVPNHKLKDVIGVRGGNVKSLQNEYKVRVDIEPRNGDYQDISAGIIVITKLFSKYKSDTIADLIDAACSYRSHTSAVNFDGDFYKIKLIFPEQMISNFKEIADNIITETANCKLADKNLPYCDERVVLIESDNRKEVKDILKKFVDVFG